MSARLSLVLLLALSIAQGLALAGCARLQPTGLKLRCSGPSGEPMARLAIRVEAEGLYRLTDAELRPVGWDVSRLDPARLHLSQGGTPAPFALQGQGRERQLVFYGHVAPTRYCDYNIYWLETTDGEGIPLPERNVSPVSEEPTQQAIRTVRFEENLTYVTQVREGDPWLGPRLHAPGMITVSLRLPHVVEGPATLRVRLWAASKAPVEPDHHLLLRLNAHPVAEARWDSQGSHLIEAKLPSGTLGDGANILTLTAPGDTGARVELAYLDWDEVTYTRALVAEGDTLAFDGQGGSYELSGFQCDDVELWEVTDPACPVRLRGHAVERGAEGYVLRFTDPVEGEHHYWAATGAALLSPAAVRPAVSSLTIPPEGADYVVIAHPSLREAVMPLVNYRAAQGLRTKVVTTEQVYARFSHGLSNPAALREFLRWASLEWPSPAPRFVLLAGDASYDPCDRLGAPFKNLVPTGLVPTQQMGETASDDWFADLDRDGLPDLAVGRLPAQNARQMQAMVAKILAYEEGAPTGDWGRRLLFVADDDDPLFVAINDGLASAVPPGYQARRIVVGRDADPRAALLAALEEGLSVVNYVGHAAIDIWAKEELLQAADVSALDQNGRLPFIVVWGCLSGYFHHPRAECLGETLLLAQGKGAVAALVPSGETMAADQQLLAQALFRHLFTTPTVGEAILRAKRELDPARPGLSELIDTTILLGDPALRLTVARYSPPLIRS
ncbi:MAG: C25 family cysteine peptidase [Chloroflexota bacterium]|nr:C25 family cysteine peptidase [Chloroflexota bacterium]